MVKPKIFFWLSAARLSPPPGAGSVSLLDLATIVQLGCLSLMCGTQVKMASKNSSSVVCLALDELGLVQLSQYYLLTCNHAFTSTKLPILGNLVAPMHLLAEEWRSYSGSRGGAIRQLIS